MIKIKIAPKSLKEHRFPTIEESRMLVNQSYLTWIFINRNKLSQHWKSTAWMITLTPWWRHQMETFPLNWPFVRGIHRSPVNSPHKGQWRGALMFFFDLRLYKRLSKQSWGWWFETLPSPLWRHCNENKILRCNYSSLFYLKWWFSGTSNTVRHG